MKHLLLIADNGDTWNALSVCRLGSGGVAPAGTVSGEGQLVDRGGQPDRGSGTMHLPEMLAG